MTQSKAPQVSRPTPTTPDIEAQEARQVILERRAQYVAMALAAACMATSACGGQSEPSDGDSGGMHPCLTLAETGGSGTTSAGGMRMCLTMVSSGGTPIGTNAGGTGNATGGLEFGGMSVCLSMAPSGGVSTSPDAGGAGNYATSGGRGGMTVCLSPGGSGGSIASGGSAMGGYAMDGGSAGMSVCLSAGSSAGPFTTGGNGPAGGDVGADQAGTAGTAGAGIAGAGTAGAGVGGMTVCLSAPISGAAMSQLSIPTRESIELNPSDAESVATSTEDTALRASQLT